MLRRTEYGLEKINNILPAIIGAVGALGSLGVGIANTINQNKANNANIKAQNQMLQYNMQNQQANYQLNRESLDWNKQVSERDFEYNKKLQEEIFQREDSAVQRMVADNRLAGLSPIAGLAGAGTGQALEANTGYLSSVSAPAVLDAPQMSANQLAVDFSSLSSLSNVIQRSEEHSDNLKIKQQQLAMEKSSNDENLKRMKAQIDGLDIQNQMARATMESKIAGLDLNNEFTKKKIAKLGYDTVGQMLSNKGKEVMNARSEAELKEWLANSDLRDEMGKAILNNTKFSLDEKKARLALATLLGNDTHSINTSQLAILGEQLQKLQDEGDTRFGLKHALEGVGVSSETSGAWQHFFDIVEGLLPSNWNLFQK